MGSKKGSSPDDDSVSEDHPAQDDHQAESDNDQPDAATPYEREIDEDYNLLDELDSSATAESRSTGPISFSASSGTYASGTWASRPIVPRNFSQYQPFFSTQGSQTYRSSDAKNGLKTVSSKGNVTVVPLSSRSWDKYDPHPQYMRGPQTLLPNRKRYLLDYDEHTKHGIHPDLARNQEPDKLPFDHPELPRMLAGLRTSLQGFATWVRGRAGEASAVTKGKGPAKPSAHLRSSQPTKRKRPVARDEDQAEDSQDDEHQGKKSRLRSGETDDDDGPFLACPFYKHNPVRYSRCLCLRIKRTGDVKQHLKRKHEQPHYCAYCGEQFGTQAVLKSHERDRSCTRAEFEEPEGVSEDQRSKLAFKVSRGKTETEQWFEIWAIVFPNTKCPDSAFVDTPEQEVLSSFRAYWNECGEEIVTEHFEQTLARSAIPTEQDGVKGMVQDILSESMGTLFDRFTQRYNRTPSSVPDSGVSSTPSSHHSEPKAAGISVFGLFAVDSSHPASNSRRSTSTSTSRHVPGNETLQADQVPNDSMLRLERGCDIEASSVLAHSSDHTFTTPSATFGHSEAQGGLEQWDAPYHSVLPGSDVRLFDDFFDTLVNTKASSTEEWY